LVERRNQVLVHFEVDEYISDEEELPGLVVGSTHSRNRRGDQRLTVVERTKIFADRANRVQKLIAASTAAGRPPPIQHLSKESERHRQRLQAIERRKEEEAMERERRIGHSIYDVSSSPEQPRPSNAAGSRHLKATLPETMHLSEHEVLRSDDSSDEDEMAMPESSSHAASSVLTKPHPDIQRALFTGTGARNLPEASASTPRIASLPPPCLNESSAYDQMQIASTTGECSGRAGRAVACNAENPDAGLTPEVLTVQAAKRKSDAIAALDKALSNKRPLRVYGKTQSLDQGSEAEVAQEQRKKRPRFDDMSQLPPSLPRPKHKK